MKSEQVDSIINSLAKVVEDLKSFKEQVYSAPTTPSTGNCSDVCITSTPPPQVCCSNDSCSCSYSCCTTTPMPYSCCCSSTCYSSTPSPTCCSCC